MGGSHTCVFAGRVHRSAWYSGWCRHLWAEAVEETSSTPLYHLSWQSCGGPMFEAAVSRCYQVSACLAGLTSPVFLIRLSLFFKDLHGVHRWPAPAGCLYRTDVCLAGCLSLWQLQQLRQHGRQLACAWAEPRSVVVSGPLGVQIPGHAGGAGSGTSQWLTPFGSRSPSGQRFGDLRGRHHPASSLPMRALAVMCAAWARCQGPVAVEVCSVSPCQPCTVHLKSRDCWHRPRSVCLFMPPPASSPAACCKAGQQAALVGSLTHRGRSRLAAFAVP